MKIVATESDQGSPTAATSLIAALPEAYPNLKAIWMFDGYGYVVPRALQEAGVPKGKIFVLAVDALPATDAGIASGWVSATMAQCWFWSGPFVASLIKAKLAGHGPTQQQWTVPLYKVAKQNLPFRGCPASAYPKNLGAPAACRDRDRYWWLRCPVLEAMTVVLRRRTARFSRKARRVSPECWIPSSTGSRQELLLELSDGWKSFGHVIALSGAHLRAYGGEILALVGDNGAGKSTLLKVFSGLYALDKGSVKVNGVAMDRADPRPRASAGSFDGLPRPCAR